MTAISREAAALIHAQRWAALATLSDGEPFASMVAYALEPGGGALLFHVSQLAQHTRDLLAHPRSSLAVSEADTLEDDPQRLQRVTISGVASVVRRGDEAYLAAAEAYIDRFPDAQMRFELGDFLLVRFTPDHVRYVGGFARAAQLSWTDVRESGSLI